MPTSCAKPELTQASQNWAGLEIKARLLNNGVPKTRERRIPAISGSGPSNFGDCRQLETVGIRRERAKPRRIPLNNREREFEQG